MNEQTAEARYEALREKFIAASEGVTECPVCESRQFARAFPHIVALVWSKVHVPSGDFYQQCTGCGTIMIDRIFPQPYYDHYLNEFYRVIPTEIGPASRREADVRARFLLDAAADFQFRPRRILEVSSYDGTTLDRLRAEFEADAFGIEPTIEAVDFAERTFPHLAGRMVRSQFENADAFVTENGPFDLVTIGAAFRQISRPLRAIELLRSCLPKGGILMIDEAGLLNDALTMMSIPALSWAVHCAQKSFMYSRDSLIALFERFGFTYLRSVSMDRFIDAREIPYQSVLFCYDEEPKRSEQRLELARLVGFSAMQVIVERTARSTEELLANVLAARP